MNVSGVGGVSLCLGGIAAGDFLTIERGKEASGDRVVPAVALRLILGTKPSTASSRGSQRPRRPARRGISCRLTSLFTHDECVRHFDSLAKNAVAFFRISRYVLTVEFWARSRATSLSISLVGCRFSELTRRRARDASRHCSLGFEIFRVATTRVSCIGIFSLQ